MIFHAPVPALFSAPAPADSLFSAPVPFEDEPMPARSPWGSPTRGALDWSPGPLPTDEQSAVLDAFLDGANVVVEAGAGTGKTSTLRLLAAAAGAGRRGLYIAYNAPVAKAARGKFPSNVDCRTAHSLAFAEIGARYAHRLPKRSNRGEDTADGPKRLPASEVAKVLGLRGEALGKRYLTGPALARLADETVAAYCRSADAEIRAEHVPQAEGMDGRAWADLAALLLPAARKLWADLCDVNGRLWFEHDHYLKMWQLTEPVLPARYIMLDEAQDADPVIAAIVGAQAHAQLVYVGDRSQAIYGWRGAVDAMATFEGRRLRLTQSFRFGQPIADEANEWLSLLGADLRLTGTDTVASTVGNSAMVGEDAILCRTNGGAIGAVIKELQAGRRVALVGGGKDIKRFAFAAKDLMAGKGCSLPELAAFKTWAALCEYVDEERAGCDLKVMVKMVQRYGPGTLIDTVNRLSTEDVAEVTVSTAHKAKGLEWPAVRIADDFAPPEDGDEPERAELMLAYVACTRAQNALDVGSLAWRRYGHVNEHGEWENIDGRAEDLAAAGWPGDE